MDIMQAIQERHSVRSYTDKIIGQEIQEELGNEIGDCNQESGLHIQLVTEEPDAFDSFMSHYGKFSGVKNYIALKVQQLGLNTCWVAQTFSKRKSKCVVNKGEKLVCVLALGYGTSGGMAHKSKSITELSKCTTKMPDWFKRGMETALLAPTAINQQKFLLTLTDKGVKAEPTGGFYSKVDLGIVKYHFEIGAGRENFSWI